MLVEILTSLFLCQNLKEEYKIKIYKEEQLSLLEDYPKEVVDSVNEIKGSKKSFSVADELLKYKELLDAGLITREEFNKKKEELII